MINNMYLPLVFIRIMAIASIITGILSIPNPYLGFMCPPLNDSAVCIVKTNLHLGEISSIFILLGLVGLYITQAKKLGLLGLIGFLIAFTGGVLDAGSTWMREFLFPILVDIDPNLFTAGYPPALETIIQIGFDTMILGWFIFGIASLRGKAFSKKAAIFLMIGIILGRFVPMGFLLGEPLFGVGLILMGRAVWLGINKSDDTSTASPEKISSSPIPPSNMT